MNPSAQAVVVSRVDQDSLAARAGLRTGDRIISINGQPVRDPNMVSQRVGTIQGDQATFIVDRDGQQQEVLVYFNNDQYSNAVPATPRPHRVQLGLSNA